MSKWKMRKRISECARSIVSLLALTAIVLPALSACGQALRPSAERAAALPDKSDEISLDLLVYNKRNKPVLDLKPGEIAVSYDNSPVKLDNFHLVTGAQASAYPVALVFDRTAAYSLGHGVDSYAAKRERDAAAKVLKIFSETYFPISVLTIDGRLRLQCGFTSERNELAQAVLAAIQSEKLTGGDTANPAEKRLLAELQTGADSSGTPVSAADRAQAEALRAALSRSVKITRDQHMPPSLAGLLALAQAMQQLPHRKSIIYFSSFMNMQSDSRAMNAIKSIIASANQAGIGIDVVDLNSGGFGDSRGIGRDLLNASTDSTLGVLAANDDLSQTADDQAKDIKRDIMAGNVERIGKSSYFQSNMPRMDPDANDVLQYLAVGTGGSYITESRLEESLKRMTEDMTTYYEAAYLPPNEDHDGKAHSIAVKSLRPDLKIRYQTSYLSVPPSTVDHDPVPPFELPLRKILSEPQLPNDLTFRAAILHMGDVPEGSVNTIAIEVPLSSLDIRQDDSTDLYAAQISIVANIKDKTGAIVKHISADIPRRGALKNIETARMDAITTEDYFTAAPGQYQLEAAVLDHNSGKAGAQRLTFEIPQASTTPSLSDMVLVRHTEPFRAEDDPADQLRYGDDTLTPNLSGQLAPGAKEVSVFFIAHPDRHATEAATLNLQVFSAGKPLGGPMIAKLADGSDSSAYLTRFSIDPPMNGLYEVKAILSQGEKIAQTSATFTLSGISPADVDTENAALPALDTVTPPSGSQVVSFSANTAQSPSPDEVRSILADARSSAMDYEASLPNFICTQITNRSIDLNGKMQWKHKDRLTERLTYVDRKEKRTVLEIEADGQKSKGDSEVPLGMTSAGEFGALLSGVFRPESKTSFEWKKSGRLGDDTVQVFDYRVAREQSGFGFQTNHTGYATVGYHGQVFIDSATHKVLRITQVADDVPATCYIHAASLSVDYGYVLINKHDYLLPVGEQTMVRRGRHEMDLNEIEFGNFHRFGSNTRILDDVSESKP